jgi:Helix-turn-helix domain
MTPEELKEAEATLALRPEFSWLTGDPSAWRNVTDVANGAGVTRQTAAAWCERGLIPGAIYYEGIGWRIPRSGLIEYFAGLQRREGKTQAG